MTNINENNELEEKKYFHVFREYLNSDNRYERDEDVETVLATHDAVIDYCYSLNYNLLKSKKTRLENTVAVCIRDLEQSITIRSVTDILSDQQKAAISYNVISHKTPESCADKLDQALANLDEFNKKDFKNTYNICRLNPDYYYSYEEIEIKEL